MTFIKKSIGGPERNIGEKRNSLHNLKHIVFSLFLRSLIIRDFFFCRRGAGLFFQLRVKKAMINLHWIAVFCWFGPCPRPCSKWRRSAPCWWTLWTVVSSWCSVDCPGIFSCPKLVSGCWLRSGGICTSGRKRGFDPCVRFRRRNAPNMPSNFSFLFLWEITFIIGD